MLSQRFSKAITLTMLFPKEYRKALNALMRASARLSAVVRHVIGGRATSLSKQSLRTCNVDNELCQALVLLRCPPILADWRTTVNAELATTRAVAQRQAT